MWLLYLYFIQGVFVDFYFLIDDSVAWAFARVERPFPPSISHFLDTLSVYGILILANGSIMIAWARYNQIRFRGNGRRRAHRSVTIADLAERYELPAEDIATWQQSRILVMTHAPDGTLSEVISKDPGQVPLARE